MAPLAYASSITRRHPRSPKPPDGRHASSSVAARPQQRNHQLVDHFLEIAIAPFAPAHLGAVHHHGRNGIEDVAVRRLGADLVPLYSASDNLAEQLDHGFDDPVEDHGMEALGLDRVALVNHGANGGTGEG